VLGCQPVESLPWLLAALFGAGAVLLAAATLLGRADRALWAAYLVELPIVLAVLVPAYLGGPLLLVALLALVLLAGRELCRVLGLAGLVPDTPVALGLAAALAAAAWAQPAALQALLGPALLGALAAPLLRGRGPGAAGATALVVIYPGACAALLGGLALGPNGFGSVLFVYAVVEVGDAFALLVGKLAGRRRLWPALSPRKTVEGSLGGIAAGLAVAYLLGFAVPDWSTGQRLGVGLSLAIVGQLGDLFASAFKRAAGVKDYSAAVPANGGVLDVYDSLLFAAPFMYAATAL
jgi:phosphatidate cytidylyltransferase